jgi:hypothetical protein
MNAYAFKRIDMTDRLFNIWRENVKSRKEYRNTIRLNWEENNQEELNETEYAKINMDSIYWCWSCIHSECDRHR